MPKKRQRKKKKISTGKKIILVAAAGVFVFSTVAVVGSAVYIKTVVSQLPSLDNFNTRSVDQTTKIYDRTGKVLLYEMFEKEKRTILPFSKIPEHLKEATLAVEDEGFYSQPAFDWKAILRAFIKNIKEGRIVQGGSTITQQLVKNAFLTPEKTITRKVKEIILAIELESRYTKDEILGAYLNQIPYGSNAYGVEAAAQTFFNKSAKNLTLDEAATLAALPKAPTYYSPWGKNIDDLIKRRDYVINRMYELGYITEEEALKAKKISTKDKFTAPTIGSIKAPHFSLMVRDYLINKYGEEKALNGGLKVITTLDWDIQKIAETAVKNGAERNKDLYGGTNAALVAQNPKNGQVLALVGSKDWYDNKIDGQFNVASQGLRQPGSALKPFIYLTAFNKGFSPKTILIDAPTEFVVGDPDCPVIITPSSENNEDCFNPDNFDHIFRGPVSMEAALAQSINVPSVKTLYLAGFDDVLKTLNNFGINTLKERWRYGLSLVLGGGEVKLIELVNAYSTLAQEGIFHRQQLVLKIEDGEGNVLEEFSDETKRVFKTQPTRLINQILSNKQLRLGLFQSSLPLTIFPGREVALKTGTTDDYKDAWSIGYTPNLVVGVWAGNNNNTPMHRRGSSILAAVPMWSNFLNRVFEEKNYPSETFSRPDPLSITNKPMLNGKVIFSPSVNGDSYPQLHSILFWVNKDNPQGAIPTFPAKDSQFNNWEGSVINWAQKTIPNFEEEYNQPIPEGINIKNNQQLIGDINITNLSPLNGEFVKLPLFVKANITVKKEIEKIELKFNHKTLQVIKPKNKKSYDFFYYISETINPQNIIKLIVTDSDNHKRTSKVIVFKK